MSDIDWISAADALALHLKKQEPLARAVEVFRAAGSAENAIKEAEKRIAKLQKEADSLAAAHEAAQAKHKSDLEDLAKAIEAKRAQGEADGAVLSATAKRRAEQVVAKAEAEAAKMIAQAEAARAESVAVLNEAKAAKTEAKAMLSEANAKLKAAEEAGRVLEQKRDEVRAKIEALAQAGV